MTAPPLIVEPGPMFRLPASLATVIVARRVSPIAYIRLAVIIPEIDGAVLSIVSVVVAKGVWSAVKSLAVRRKQ